MEILKRIKFNPQNAEDTIQAIKKAKEEDILILEPISNLILIEVLNILVKNSFKLQGETFIKQ